MICKKKINLFHILPKLLLPSEEMCRFQPKTTSQSEDESLSAVNQPYVLASKCANGGESTSLLQKNRISVVIGGHDN